MQTKKSIDNNKVSNVVSGENLSGNKASGKRQMTRMSVPPPLPPPRDSSLTRNKSGDSSNRNSSWLHRSGKRSSKAVSQPNLDQVTKTVNGQISKDVSSTDFKVNSEMVEVSIYTKTRRDGDKITHVDDHGNEISPPISPSIEENYVAQTPNNKLLSIPKSKLSPRNSMVHEKNSFQERDLIENKKNLEPYRKRSESQPVIFRDREINNGDELSSSCRKSGAKMQHQHQQLNGSSSNSGDSSRQSSYEKKKQSKLSSAKITNSKLANQSIPPLSSSNKRQQAPLPPKNENKARTILTTAGMYRSIEDLSSLNKGGIDGDLDESNAPQVSSETLQELRRATSLVVANSKKGGDCNI